MSSIDKYVVGVDMGGTNIRAGVVDPEGNLLSFVKYPTSPDKEVEAVISQTCEIIRSSISESNQPIDKIAGISIGACGLVDRKNGRFISSSVMPKWDDVPLAQTISQSLRLPVKLDNDAQAAIWGEWWVGVAKGTSVVVGMTLGTGIGGGATFGGNIFYGIGGYACEFGHMTVDPNGPECFCGNHGCLGQLASVTSMVHIYQQLKQRESLSLDEKDIYITSQVIYELALIGDELANRVIVQTGKYLGIGTANLLNCFNPDMVVFTGGMTRMGKLLLEVIREEARQRVYPPIYQATRIEFGQLVDKAGVIGSAGIFYKNFDEQIRPTW